MCSARFVCAAWLCMYKYMYARQRAYQNTETSVHIRTHGPKYIHFYPSRQTTPHEVYAQPNSNSIARMFKNIRISMGRSVFFEKKKQLVQTSNRAFLLRFGFFSLASDHFFLFCCFLCMRQRTCVCRFIGMGANI